MTFTGDLLNAAPGAVGSAVPGAYSLYVAGNVPSGYVRAWGPNGYKSLDNTNWDHTQVNEFAWNFPGWSGYWYSYVKSICTHSSDKAIYRFDSASSLPADYGGGGWHG